MQGEPGAVGRGRAGVADPAHLPPSRRLKNPTEQHLKKARGAVFDVRNLRSTVIKKERPEHPAPGEAAAEAGADPDASAALPTETLPVQLDQSAMSKSSASAAAAPPPLSSFAGLDFANWGAGHPPDTNGDVGPTYYIQTINTSIGIYDKSSGNRVAAFTFDAFMSQGQFGNLCDTDNFGDPVVLYDSFEDRWFITDFAFKLDASGNVNPQARLPVLRRLEDRRPGQRRLELLLDRDSRRPRRLPEVRHLAGRDLHVGEHVRLQLDRRRTPASTCGRSTSSRCTTAIPARRWSISPATAPISRCCRPTPGSRPGRRLRERPSTSSRPSSS